MFSDEEVARYHIINHVLARKGVNPEQAWGERHFSIEPTDEGFRRVLEMMGVRPGMRIIHTHTTSDRFRRLLESAGAKVDAYDISLDSALRAKAKLADASRLLEWSKLRNRYDAAFSFEPTHLFHLSGSVITGAAYLASLMHAVKDGNPIYIAAGASYSGGSPADNFQAVFDWMREHFGLKYTMLRDSSRSMHNDYIFVPSRVEEIAAERDKNGVWRSVRRTVIKPVPLAVFRILSDPRVQKRLLEFARAADRAIVPISPHAQIMRAMLTARGDTYSKVREQILERAVPRLQNTIVPTVHGPVSAYDLILSYARRGNSYLKTF